MISVIVPIYNAENYLNKCIDSILGQTYGDLEVILVNDGSTDASRSICEDYQRRDKRVKLLNQKNGGASLARNKGIDHSSGEYIAFVDSDDFLKRDMYEIMLGMCVQGDADIAVCQTLDLRSYDESVDLNNDGSYSVYDRDSVFKNLYSAENVYNVSPCNKLYRSFLFEKVRFPEGIIYEDVASIFQLLYYSRKIAVTSDVLYFYYLSPKSIMRSDFSLKNLDLVKAMDIKLNFFKATGMKDIYQRVQLEYLLNLGDLYVRLYFSKLPDKGEYLSYLKKKRKDLKKESRKNMFYSRRVRIVDMISFTLPHVVKLRRLFGRRGS